MLTPTAYLGIDIAKLTFEAVPLMADGKAKHRSFSNDEAGYQALTGWLRHNRLTDSGQVHACSEATGHYGDALARYLHTGAHRVSVVNPAAIRAFARTELSRTKTDKADAAGIARYCLCRACATEMHRPPAWAPPAEEITTLLALVRRPETLKQMRLMERQRPRAVLPLRCAPRSKPSWTCWRNRPPRSRARSASTSTTTPT